MNFGNIDKQTKRDYLSDYDVYMDDSGTYPVLYLYLSDYFEERGHPYNLIKICPYQPTHQIVKAMKSFRTGAAYFFEGSMRLAELSHEEKDTLRELLKFEYLCSLHSDDMQRIFEAYKSARMELVRDLILKGCK